PRITHAAVQRPLRGGRPFGLSVYAGLRHAVVLVAPQVAARAGVVHVALAAVVGALVIDARGEAQPIVALRVAKTQSPERAVECADAAGTRRARTGEREELLVAALARVHDGAHLPVVIEL